MGGFYAPLVNAGFRREGRFEVVDPWGEDRFHNRSGLAGGSILELEWRN